MTAPPQDVPTELADLRGLLLAEMGEGAPVALDMVVRRVLPTGAAVRGAAFSSSI